MKDVPEILDKITDVVLAYRPKSKQKKARKRKKAARNKSSGNSKEKRNDGQ
jgi:hypothetical protein